MEKVSRRQLLYIWQLLLRLGPQVLKLLHEGKLMGTLHVPREWCELTSTGSTRYVQLNVDRLGRSQKG